MRRAAHLRVARNRGFTLVELIATIVILAAVGSVASLMIGTSIDGYAAAATRAQLHSELSVTLDRIDRELRKIPPEGGGVVAPDIVAITAASIQWNGNYRFHVSSGRLFYTDGGGTARILQEDVTAFSVQAFDESNTQLAATLNDAACNAVRRLRITVTVQRAGVTESLRTKLFLRCTMEGATT